MIDSAFLGVPGGIVLLVIGVGFINGSKGRKNEEVIKTIGMLMFAFGVVIAALNILVVLFMATH